MVISATRRVVSSVSHYFRCRDYKRGGAHLLPSTGKLIYMGGVYNRR